jgi:hypothetical protein
MIIKQNSGENSSVNTKADLMTLSRPKHIGMEVFVNSDESLGGVLSKYEFVGGDTQWALMWVDGTSASPSITVVDELIFSQGSNIFHNQSGSYGWKDLQSPFTVRTTNSQNNPSWAVLFNGMQGLVFSKSTMNQVWVDFHIDHDYAMGTLLYPHVHWCPTTTDSGVVRWGIEYTVAKGHQQQAFPSTTIVYVEQTVNPNTQWMHFVAEVSEADAIQPTNVEPDTVIKIRFFRDSTHPNDTYPAVVHAWQGDIHYQTARFSSVNKSPNFFG